MAAISNSLIYRSGLTHNYIMVFLTSYNITNLCLEHNKNILVTVEELCCGGTTFGAFTLNANTMHSE